MKRKLTLLQRIKLKLRGHINIYDDKVNCIYAEDSSGKWIKYCYDDKGNCSYIEYSNGEWYKYTYDDKDNWIYSECSNGVWHKYIYDDRGNLIYTEEGSNSYTYEEMYKATIKYLKEKEMWNCTYSKETLNKLRELGQFNGKELNDVLAQIIETKNRNK